MAENTAQERTEEATPKRKRDVRKKGQVPRSKELTTFASLMGAGLGILVYGRFLLSTLNDFMSSSFVLDRSAIFNSGQILVSLEQSVLDVFFVLLPLLLMVFAAIAASSFALGGFLFAPSLAAPKWERLNIIKGFGRMFSLKSLIELIKTIGKFLLVSVMVAIVFNQALPDLLQLSVLPLERALSFAGSLALWCFFAYSLVLVFIVLIDVPFQLFEHQKQIRMTRQELKD
ncbi:MAG: EscU/YscU/HrcU family type III secretion system export apparatus switch protein, partial [Pseudomonadales bacterium]|nr:EscU/YscU/HrcU family type III secretion system export apparatus switch protein [Pseudomonadales bacterium]